ncbi:mitochondrial fission process protein 1 [Teleopsis dalmanni]|uniref:mitochondrial fission process protein 1 n=1 Tax=Teleopsis dalmanni TaxID=139649 RepID=UPI0018CF3AD0|nr:mitochondrial fission process protein 1 [Teleopsis dalmanni]
MKEEDIYRDTYIRYLGYANEVGESFRPLVPRSAVLATYGISIGYVFADAYDKCMKAQKLGASSKTVAIRTGDVFIWQMLASVVIPGYTINRITWASKGLLKSVKASKPAIKILPTVLGLASIPLIIHPIDHMVDYIMDNTYRKWLD